MSSRVLPPTRSSDVSLSNALSFIEDLHQHGLAFAPAMPEPEALEAAARKANITPKQALHAYLSILAYE